MGSGASHGQIGGARLFRRSAAGGGEIISQPPYENKNKSGDRFPLEANTSASGAAQAPSSVVANRAEAVESTPVAATSVAASNVIAAPTVPRSPRAPRANDINSPSSPASAESSPDTIAGGELLDAAFLLDGDEDVPAHAENDAEVFAHTALSLGMDHDDLLFNILYFGGAETTNFNAAISNARDETMALHSENNTPYKLRPAAASVLGKLKAEPLLSIIELEEKDCAVCKDDMEVGVQVVHLPACKHCFHEDCLIRWLKLQGFCPVCRAPLTEEVLGNDSESDPVKKDKAPSAAGGGMVSKDSAYFTAFISEGGAGASEALGFDSDEEDEEDEGEGEGEESVEMKSKSEEKRESKDKMRSNSDDDRDRGSDHKRVVDDVDIEHKHGHDFVCEEREKDMFDRFEDDGKYPIDNTHTREYSHSDDQADLADRLAEGIDVGKSPRVGGDSPSDKIPPTQRSGDVIRSESKSVGGSELGSRSASGSGSAGGSGKEMERSPSQSHTADDDNKNNNKSNKKDNKSDSSDDGVTGAGINADIGADADADALSSMGRNSSSSSREESRNNCKNRDSDSDIGGSGGSAGADSDMLRADAKSECANSSAKSYTISTRGSSRDNSDSRLTRQEQGAQAQGSRSISSLIAGANVNVDVEVDAKSQQKASPYDDDDNEERSGNKPNDGDSVSNQSHQSNQSNSIDSRGHGTADAKSHYAEEKVSAPKTFTSASAKSAKDLSDGRAPSDSSFKTT